MSVNDLKRTSFGVPSDPPPIRYTVAPAYLPASSRPKIEFVINLKTAKDLGLTISRQVLLITDEVIE